MRFQIIYMDVGYHIGNYSRGVGCLITCLKNNHHKVKLTHLTGIELEKCLEKVDRDIKNFQPDMIGFSTTEIGVSLLKKIADHIKKEHNLPIMIGGSYPTLYPEELIRHEAIDYVFRGEGEITLIEFMNGKNLNLIRGLYYKKNGKIKKNDNLRLTKPEEFVIPDRESFDKSVILNSKGLGNITTLPMMCVRGCPYNCSYCINNNIKNLYKDKQGGFIRYTPVELVIEEIKQAQKKYNFGGVTFFDDILMFNKEWLNKFCVKYREEIGLPFFCNLRVELVDEGVMKKLKEAGCKRVGIGIECGDEEYRKQYLNRFMTNKQIFNAFKLAEKFGLQKFSFSMIGLPYETEKQIKKTVELNALCKVDFMFLSIFFPFRGTRLGDYCYERGYINLKKKERTFDYFRNSVLNDKSIDKRKIEFYKKWFKLLVYLKSRNLKRTVRETARLIIRPERI